MKKFFVALTILFCIAGNVEAATEFTDEQRDRIISGIISQTSDTDKPLNLDVATFRKNFNAFITNFFSKGNDPDRSDKLTKTFLIGEPKLVTAGTTTLFIKRFLSGIAIVGSVDESGNFKVLNFFAAMTEDRKEKYLRVLVLDAFVRGISPDNDTTTLLTESKENSSGTVTKGGVKFSFATAGDMNIVSAVAE